MWRRLSGKISYLKTSDNFYLYKADIKKWLGEMRQNLPWLEQVCVRNKQLRGKEIQVNELIKQIDMISEDLMISSIASSIWIRNISDISELRSQGFNIC